MAPSISIKPPIATPGTKALIFESSADRRTWALQGVDSWYLGPATEHYRCYLLYVPKNRAERTTKIVQFFPHQCPVPKTSSVDAAIISVRALTEALSNPASAVLFAQFGDAQQQSIVDLSEIYESDIAKPALPSIIPLQPAARMVTPPPPRVPIPQHIRG